MHTSTDAITGMGQSCIPITLNVCIYVNKPCYSVLVIINSMLDDEDQGRTNAHWELFCQLNTQNHQRRKWCHYPRGRRQNDHTDLINKRHFFISVLLFTIKSE